MSLRVDEDRVVRTLERLVRCDSVNPAFTGAGGGPGRGEGPIAELAVELLREIGLEVAVIETTPGRPSVVGRLPGAGGGRSLILNGHLDTVGPGAMEAPFEPRIEGERLYGRGACDMKGGLAACLGAVAAIAESRSALRGDLLVALVADEEEASLGTADVVERHRPDGAIVAEPTGLRIALAHKGFEWIRVTTEGFACHGSDAEQGVDANARMGPVVAEVGRLAAELRSRPAHPLVGSPSLHVALLRGGAGPSIYSPSCVAQLERRTVPGEADAGGEIRRRLGMIDPALRGPLAFEEVLARPPFEAASPSRVAGILGEAAQATAGFVPEAIGVPYWTDAALLRAAGADVVVFGPTGEGEHRDVEWVDLRSVVTCAGILAEAARRYCA